MNDQELGGLFINASEILKQMFHQAESEFKLLCYFGTGPKVFDLANKLANRFKNFNISIGIDVDHNSQYKYPIRMTPRAELGLLRNRDITAQNSAKSIINGTSPYASLEVVRAFIDGFESNV